MKNIWVKLIQLKSRKFYGIVSGIVLFSCFVGFFIYPAVTQAEGSLIFLRITFPSPPVSDEMQVAADYEDASEMLLSENTEDVSEMLPPEDTDKRLVSMLMKDDFEIAYDKLENKESWHVVRMRVTGYCTCRKCCGKFSDGKTASNRRIRKGDVFVAADKYYRFGTQMIIPGYNSTQSVQVLDRGRVIKGNRLDLYFDSHSQAKKWGVKYLDVLVKTDR